MIWLFEINVIRKGSNGRYVTINAHECFVMGDDDSIKRELPILLQNLKVFLEEKDEAGVISILNHPRLRYNWNTFLRVIEKCFTSTFEDYLVHLYELIYEKWETSLPPKTPRTPIERLIEREPSAKGPIALKGPLESLTKAYKRYLKNNFNKFIEACSNNDFDLVKQYRVLLGYIRIMRYLEENEADKLVFNSFVRRIGNELIKKEKAYTKSELVKHIFVINEDSGEVKKFATYDVFREVSSHLYKTVAEKKNTYTLSDDVWEVRERNGEGYISKNFDFTSIWEEDKTYVKAYIHYMISNTAEGMEETYKRLHGIKSIYVKFEDLPYKNVDSIFKMNRLHLHHLLDHFQQARNKQNKVLKLNTIAKYFGAARGLVEWYKENYNKNQSNEFNSITFRNLESFSERQQYIPEEVVAQLEQYLYEMPDMFQNAWIVMMNTGMRFSDLTTLDEECLSYNDEIGCFVLTYINQKMREGRVRNGDSKYHRISVNTAVVQAVEQQKEFSFYGRETSGLKEIFLHFNGRGFVFPEASALQYHVNKIIKKYSIKDANGEIYHFGTHQCRKTITADLISKGKSLREIADYLDQSERVAARHYRDMQLLKIAELDAKMFEQLFEGLLEEEVKGQYSEEEKQALMKEIKLGARETPEGHGTCVKHVALGPCMKKKCVGCKMLMTGPQKLPKWYRLYEEQGQHIKELEKEYMQSGVDDYHEHRSYQEEIHLLGVYSDTIESIETWAKGRSISIEQYKQEFQGV
ncbi:site-specific integrase [Ectobacillus funiculus]|uniref:tyrosine-type recombinase/integrase n=1 Tax=Ectobacillus funiculus TaxID=137993 RepID=UPI003977ECCF